MILNNTHVTEASNVCTWQLLIIKSVLVFTSGHVHKKGKLCDISKLAKN